ncbi:hypothetical protein CYMTET_52092 [Cymbomonas tetramitiformis]|uniref:Uncharacterized protein n=1 Tax=Cymbomonas tetramitiformis TaxID=36881 RepID=A0AAE0ES00_9CHLO|nr:hypothetical protein CYMTET_52092 [Cymbomonas tetramitiformis]
MLTPLLDPWDRRTRTEKASWDLFSTTNKECNTEQNEPRSQPDRVWLEKFILGLAAYLPYAAYAVCNKTPISVALRCSLVSPALAIAAVGSRLPPSFTCIADGSGSLTSAISLDGPYAKGKMATTAESILGSIIYSCGKSSVKHCAPGWEEKPAIIAALSALAIAGPQLIVKGKLSPAFLALGITSYGLSEVTSKLMAEPTHVQHITSKFWAAPLRRVQNWGHRRIARHAFASPSKPRHALQRGHR